LSNNYSGNTLITMHNIAQPMNHLLTIQLVNSPSAPSTKTNFKAQYFYFLTLAPGAGSGANRTYDFTAKINMKYSIAEVFGLAFILQQVAAGNTRVLPYTKFSKSATGQKNVAIIENIKQGNNGPVRQITIFVGCNGKKHSLNLSPAEAYALAKQLDLSATEATKLEFSRLSSTPRVSQNHTSIPRDEPPAPAPFQMPPVEQMGQMPPLEQMGQIQTVEQMPPLEQMGQIQTVEQTPPEVQSQPIIDTPNTTIQQPQHTQVNNVVDRFSSILNSQN